MTRFRVQGPRFSQDFGYSCYGIKTAWATGELEPSEQEKQMLVAVVATPELAYRIATELNSDQFPTELSVDMCGKVVPVIVGQIPGESELLGQWNEKTCEIHIADDQPKAQMYIVLLHEMLHMAETQIIANHPRLGRIYDLFFRRTFGEKIVEYVSCYLFQWLGCNGMLRGISRAEAVQFVQEHAEEVV